MTTNRDAQVGISRAHSDYGEDEELQRDDLRGGMYECNRQCPDSHTGHTCSPGGAVSIGKTRGYVSGHCALAYGERHVRVRPCSGLRHDLTRADDHGRPSPERHHRIGHTATLRISWTLPRDPPSFTAGCGLDGLMPETPMALRAPCCALPLLSHGPVAACKTGATAVFGRGMNAHQSFSRRCPSSTCFRTGVKSSIFDAVQGSTPCALNAQSTSLKRISRC